MDNSCANNGNGSSQTCASSAGAAGPFNSMANTQAKAGGYLGGDNILLKKGQTFAERLTFTWSGSLNNVITIGAYGIGVNPILNPALDYPIYLNGVSYITVDGVDVNTAVAGSTGVKQSGTNSNIILQNMTVTAGQYAMSASGSVSTELINSCVFSITSGYAVYFFGTSNQNITVSNMNTTNGIMRFRNIQNLIVHNIAAISNLSAYGSAEIQVETGSGQLDINGVTSTGTVGGLINIMNSAYISGSATVKNVSSFSSIPKGLNGISVDNSSNIDFSNFTIDGVAGNGVLASNGSYNITFTDGTAQNNLDDGMDTTDTAHDILFLRCIVRNNGTKSEPVPQSSGDGFSTHNTNYNIKFRYCQSDNNTGSGFALWGTSSGEVSNCVAYNNGGDWTSYGGGPTSRAGLAVVDTSLNPVTSNVFVVKNSIFSHNYPVEVRASQFWYSNTGSNYNLYYPTDNNSFYFVNETATMGSWLDYYTTNNYEQNSSNADPQFVSTITPDFRLQSSSPAINAGTNVGLTSDYIGTTVPQGSAPDIGAYEFLALTTAPTSLAQYSSDGTSGIATGAFLGAGTTIVFKFNMSANNNPDSLTPQIEIRPIGTAFTNTPNYSGPAVAYSGTNVTGAVTVSDLGNGTSYHWQARIQGGASATSWTSYGNGVNSDFALDWAIPGAPSCNDSVTTSAPNLFEIRTTKSTATLYFAPPTMPYSNFYIAYSRDPNTWEYGTQYDQGYSGGVLRVTINDLSPNTKYYFKIRPGNGCATGNYGNTMTATTTSGSQTRTSYKNAITAVYQTVKSVVGKVAPTKTTTKTTTQTPAQTSQPTAPNQPQATTKPAIAQSSAKKFCILWWCF